jgi:transcription elongation factor Elf1
MPHKVVKTDSETFNKKYEGTTSPLHWCPKCGHKLIESQISISGGKQAIIGAMCKVCGYIHNMTIK